MTPDDIEAIRRRQMIAQMLMQRGQEPLETTQMAGGYVVPVSPLQGLDKVVSSLSGAYLSKRAGEEETALKQQKLDALDAVDFNSDEAANQLAQAGYVDEAVKMRMEQAKAMRGESGTPGQWYIPAGATPFKDEATGLVGYKTKEGAIIPSRAAMTDYQQAMTSPDVVAALANAREGQKNIEITDPLTGETSNRSLSAANPIDYPAKGGDFSKLIGGLIGVESGGNPNAVSPVGARGLTQIMPATAKAPGHGVAPMRDDSVDEQIRFGSDYLRAMIKHFGGDVKKGLAAYNGGIGNANIPETQKYADNVLKRAGLMTSRSAEATAQAKAMAELPVKLAEEKAKSTINVSEKKAIKESEIETDQEAKKAIKIAGAQESLPLLNDAEGYLQNTLSGGIDSFGNKIAEVMGVSTEKGKNAAALNAIGSALTSTVPRAPGAQSDIELKYAQQQAGSIADSTIPAETRLKAVEYLKKRNEMIAQGKLVASPKDVEGALYGKTGGDDREAKLKALRAKHGL
jgi:soluble lytic murein transglycosylase-like protein